MPNEQEEIIDSQNDTETTENLEETVDTDNSSEEGEDLETLRKEIETLKFQKEHWKKKATDNKISKVEVKSVSKNTNDLSSLDIIALSKANIEDEDIQEVLDYAKFKKISVAEALKSSVVKATLSEKLENRKSAEASNIGNTRRGVSKSNDAEIIGNARKGILPKENDDDAIARLAKIR